MNRILIATLIAAAALAAAVPMAAAAAAPAAQDDASHPVNDAFLKTKILGEYAVNPHVSALKLDVRVENGIAWLGGTATSPTERDLAIEIARGVDGVRKVHSQIVVQKPMTTAQADPQRRDHRTVGEGIDDGTITTTLKARLIANDSTPGTKINVTTRRGVVTLTGAVDSDAQKELAGRIAENTEHVREVHNELTVSGAKH
jgi:osmotically-inducible protein OsmY